MFNKIVSNLPASVTKLTAFSDCCGGQNRNENIAMTWMYICKNTKMEEVDHKLFEPGHSCNKYDNDFGLIDKRK